ncbi:MAG: exopolysaccharide biosynthesis protein [Alphaproteobacteria bacterium]|nr:exopolysaccharide biosynthesis protein [Alphaproteobacteria bacterium]
MSLPEEAYIMPEDEKKVSEILQDMANSASDGEITVKDMLDLAGDRALYFAAMLFALPGALPFIGNIAIFEVLMGLPVTIIGVLMMTGHQKLWLPPHILKHKFSGSWMKDVFEKGVFAFRLVERYSAIRLPELTGAAVERVIGILFVWMSIACFFDVHLSESWAPRLVVVLSFGLLSKDGYVVAGGLGLTLLTVLLS